MPEGSNGEILKKKTDLKDQDFCRIVSRLYSPCRSDILGEICITLKFSRFQTNFHVLNIFFNLIDFKKCLVIY